MIVGAVVSSIVTVVASVSVQPFASVIATVNISPLTAPLAVGLCNVLSSNVAEPFELHTHETASPPVSFKITSEPGHNGPLLDAVAVGNGFSVKIIAVLVALVQPPIVVLASA